MKSSDLISNTDQVNRQHFRIPVNELTSSIERFWKLCQERGLPPLLPSNLAHDSTRPIGWSYITGVLLCADMARQLGGVQIPETDYERQVLNDFLQAYWYHNHHERCEPYKADLTLALSGHDLTDACWCGTSTAALCREGLATSVFPKLFAENVTDADGLTPFHILIDDFQEVQPGVFKEKASGLAVFAHPYFRRSLSRQNNLNAYFLKRFSQFARSNRSLPTRLRLDPDMVGWAASAEHAIELEYWHGPKFDPEIHQIASGVATHKASESTRTLEGIDKTEVWWTKRKSQPSDEGNSPVHEFEVEELVENLTLGISPHHYGCRYAHAEYSSFLKSITHFDGAIRAYEEAAYMDRLDVSIDKAGKKAIYTKLFRLDGAIGIEAWKSLLTDYYRGNPLIPEYLGIIEASEAALMSDDISEPDKIVMPPLSAFVAFGNKLDFTKAQVIPHIVSLSENCRVEAAELGVGELKTFLLPYLDEITTGIYTYKDDNISMSPLFLGDGEHAQKQWLGLVDGLVSALETDLSGGLYQQLALPFVWNKEGVSVTFSLAGQARLVLDLLRRIKTVASPIVWPSEWIAEVNDLLKELSPALQGKPDIWPLIRRDNALRIPRPAPTLGELEFSRELFEKIKPILV